MPTRAAGWPSMPRSRWLRTGTSRCGGALRLDQLNGTGQADFFLTYVGCPPLHQIPPDAALKINCDIVEFCHANVPHWVPISMAGYNAADSGLNAYQELAAVFACNIAHIDEVKRRGSVPIESLAYALGGVNFRVAMDFFEDICKLRVARKMWHDILRDRYGITDERALRLRIHIVTAGSAMTYQEPINNVVRGTIMGLAAALGGVQSMGISAYDEALSVPSEQAHQQSVRAQQILMHETNLPAVADPLGGSYYVEALSAELEERAYAFLGEIEAAGGFIEATDSGFLAGVASENQVALEAAITTAHVRSSESTSTPARKIRSRSTDSRDPSTHGNAAWNDSKHCGPTATDTRRGRAIEDLEHVCRSGGNVMTGVMEAVGHDVTVGEVGDVFRDVYGSWQFPVHF